MSLSCWRWPRPATPLKDRRQVANAKGICLPPSSPSDGYRVAIVMALIQMLAAGTRFLPSILIEPMKGDLGLGDAAIGLLQGPAFAIVNGAAVIPMILLVRTWPITRILVFAVLGSSMATLACGLAGSVETLIPARMLLGLAQAAIAPAAMELIVATMVPAHRGRGISFFTAGAALGRGLAMIGGGGLLVLFALSALPIAPWRLTFASAGLFGIPLALLVLRLGEPVGQREDRHGRLGEALKQMTTDRPVLLPLILAAGCAVLALQSLTSWSASLLIRLHGLTPSRAGLYVGVVMMAAGAGGHALGGTLADRLRRGKRDAAPALMLLGLALCAFALWPLTQMMSLAAALMALAVAVAGLSIALVNALIGLQARIPSKLRIEGTAIFLTIVTLLGTALGPWAVGLASQMIAGPTGLAAAIGWVLSATCLIGGGAAWIARRRHG